MLTTLITIIGLILFEVTSSIDNAIINAKVLKTMGAQARRWFLTWGIFISVFLIRFMIPWLIIWATNNKLGFIGSFLASFSTDPSISHTIEQSAPVLFAGGGTFLLLLFFSWLFLEDKHYGIRGERFFRRQSLWFYTIASIILLSIIWFSLKINPVMSFSAALGSTIFFLTNGFRQGAEELEAGLMTSKKSDASKILFLEILDSNFSIDGVLGAFAFTTSIPLILIGSGVGAIIVRQLTVGNMDKIKKYIYLENGAMYSIFFLGFFMVLESFGVHIPTLLSPIITICIISFFFYKSHLHIKNTQ